MKLRQLGKTSLRVTGIALGTVEIGLDYGIPSSGGHQKPSEEEAIRFLNQAVDAGVNFIDTARAYGNSEDLIGRALSGRREQFMLATKLAPVHTDELADEQALSAKVRGSVEDSLRRLRTDRVDLLMLHSAPLELIQRGSALLKMLCDLKTEGLTRSIGASVYEEAGEAAVQCGAFDVIQIGYNALDRSLESGALPAARQLGIGMVARSVLLKGVLTERYKVLPPELAPLQSAAARLEEIAASAGISLVELAYRYVLSEEDVVALCGTARMHELQEVIDYAERGPLPDDVIRQIRGIQVSERRLLNPGTWPF